MAEEYKIRKSEELGAQVEAFDTFWEGPEDVEKGTGIKRLILSL